MSKIYRLLFVKFVITLIITAVPVGLYDHNSIAWIITVALIATILNILIGDLLILGTLGNSAASIFNGMLTVLMAYTLDTLSPGLDTSFRGLVFLAILIAFVEYYFHIYLLRSKEFEP